MCQQKSSMGQVTGLASPREAQERLQNRGEPCEVAVRPRMALTACQEAHCLLNFFLRNFLYEI